MPTPIFVLVLAVTLGSATAAQSSVIDLSTPMIGKSRFVDETDGKPADLGVPLHRSKAVAAHTTRDIAGTTTSSDGPKTASVRGYVLTAGTTTSHVRSAARKKR